MRRWLIGVSLVAVVAVVAVSGCATLARQAFANPVVTVKDVKVKGVGMQGGSLDLILDVYNPNEYRLDASRITYVVWVDSGQIATGEIEKLLTLTDKGNSEVIVPVNFTFASVQRALVHYAQRGSVDYRVTGEFTMKTPFGSVTRPYAGAGRLDTFR